MSLVSMQTGKPQSLTIDQAIERFSKMPVGEQQELIVNLHRLMQSPTASIHQKTMADLLFKKFSQVTQAIH